MQLIQRIVLIAALFLVAAFAAFETRNFNENLGATIPATCTVGDVSYDTDDQITYRCTASDTFSAVNFPPAYGQLYENGAGTVINITTGGTFVQWVSSTAGLSNLTTPSIASDNITIDTGGGGVYLVGFQVSYSGSNNEVYHWAVFVEGAEVLNISSERKISPGDMGSQSGVGLVTLAATDVVDLRVTSVSDATTATVDHAQLTITRVGI